MADPLSVSSKAITTGPNTLNLPLKKCVACHFRRKNTMYMRSFP